MGEHRRRCGPDLRGSRYGGQLQCTRVGYSGVLRCTKGVLGSLGVVLGHLGDTQRVPKSTKVYLGAALGVVEGGYFGHSHFLLNIARTTGYSSVCVLLCEYARLCVWLCPCLCLLCVSVVVVCACVRARVSALVCVCVPTRVCRRIRVFVWVGVFFHFCRHAFLRVCERVQRINLCVYCTCVGLCHRLRGLSRGAAGIGGTFRIGSGRAFSFFLIFSFLISRFSRVGRRFDVEHSYRKRVVECTIRAHVRDRCRRHHLCHRRL